MDNTKTGAIIKQLRKEKGLTQLQLAEMLHITDRAVSKWERGLCAPDISLLEPLSRILGVSIVELIEGELSDIPPQAENTAVTVIDYSAREIHEKSAKNRRTLNISIGLTGLILCILLSSFIFSRIHAQKADEALLMNHMYSQLREIAQQADYLLGDDLSREDRSGAFLDLHYALRIAADELENGYYFVSDSVPAAASWWFSERAADLSNHQQTFLTEQGDLSAEGKAFLVQLRDNMLELIDAMVGEDQMNIDSELTIEEFSSIISDFYNNH